MVTIKKTFALLIMGGASLLFVHVGQNTDFPGLSELLGGASSTTEGPEETTDFGGDEFLD